MYQPSLNKKTLTFDVNNPQWIPRIKLSLYRTCGHDLIYHFSVLYDWIYRNEVE